MVDVVAELESRLRQSSAATLERMVQWCAEDREPELLQLVEGALDTEDPVRAIWQGLQTGACSGDRGADV